LSKYFTHTLTPILNLALINTQPSEFKQEIANNRQMAQVLHSDNCVLRWSAQQNPGDHYEIYWT
jgi:hypothetical protein